MDCRIAFDIFFFSGEGIMVGLARVKERELHTHQHWHVNAAHVTHLADIVSY